MAIEEKNIQCEFFNPQQGWQKCGNDIYLRRYIISRILGFIVVNALFNSLWELSIAGIYGEDLDSADGFWGAMALCKYFSVVTIH